MVKSDVVLGPALEVEATNPTHQSAHTAEIVIMTNGETSDDHRRSDASTLACWGRLSAPPGPLDEWLVRGWCAGGTRLVRPIFTVRRTERTTPRGCADMSGESDDHGDTTGRTMQK